MADDIMDKIKELSGEREGIVAREGTHHATGKDHERLTRIDHDLQVLWDLRRRDLAGERVSLQEDYFDRYDRYTGEDGPGV